jgi:hypothetical protein
MIHVKNNMHDIYGFPMTCMMIIERDIGGRERDIGGSQTQKGARTPG